MTDERRQQLYRFIEHRLFWRTERLADGLAFVGVITQEHLGVLVSDLVQFIDDPEGVAP